MKTLIIALMIGICLLFTGCGPETAEIISDPNVVVIESAVEGAVGVVGLLGTLWPALIPIGTAGAGILAAYKRLKPKIIEANKENEKYYAAGETLATVLEDIKTNEPDLWEKIGPKIADATKTASDIEETIRGFRHLEPKGV